MSAQAGTWPDQLFAAIKHGGVRQVGYVPDAGHARLIDRCRADAESGRGRHHRRHAAGKALRDTRRDRPQRQRVGADEADAQAERIGRSGNAKCMRGSLIFIRHFERMSE